MSVLADLVSILTRPLLLLRLPLLLGPLLGFFAVLVTFLVPDKRHQVVHRALVCCRRCVGLLRVFHCRLLGLLACQAVCHELGWSHQSVLTRVRQRLWARDVWHRRHGACGDVLMSQK